MAPNHSSDSTLLNDAWNLTDIGQVDTYTELGFRIQITLKFRVLSQDPRLYIDTGG